MNWYDTGVGILFPVAVLVWLSWVTYIGYFYFVGFIEKEEPIIRDNKLFKRLGIVSEDNLIQATMLGAMVGALVVVLWPISFPAFAVIGLAYLIRYLKHKEKT